MPPQQATSRNQAISAGRLYAGQMSAYYALHGGRFGKTQFEKTWIIDGFLRGEVRAGFAPRHMTASEVYSELQRIGTDPDGPFEGGRCHATEDRRSPRLLVA